VSNALSGCASLVLCLSHVFSRSGSSGSAGPSVSNATAMTHSVPSSNNEASHFHHPGQMSSAAGRSPAARPNDWSAAPHSFSSMSEPHGGTPPLGQSENGDGGWQSRAARGTARGRGRGGTGYNGSPGHAQYNESMTRSPASAQRRSASPSGSASRARYPDRGGPGAAGRSRSPPAAGASRGGYGPGSNSKDGSGGQNNSSVGDLSTFDPSTFDPTDPASLDRLAKMFQNTYNVSNGVRYVVLCCAADRRLCL
jgi:translation initiation factor IF-2